MNGARVAKQRRRFLPIVGVLLACCSSPSARAPQSPRSAVDEIVAAHLVARGGAERLRKLRSLRETALVTARGGRIARAVREVEKPGKLRLEFTYQGTTSIFANDGESGWQIAPLQGQFEPERVAAAVDAAAGVDQRDIEGYLVDWREKGHVVELVGRESLGGRDVDHLKVTLQGGAVRHDYIDAESHQIVRSDVPRVVRGHATVVENSFAEFRAVDGIVFPHLIETHVRERPEGMKIVVQRIELDPELDAARFRFPD